MLPLLTDASLYQTPTSSVGVKSRLQELLRGRLHPAEEIEKLRKMQWWLPNINIPGVEGPKIQGPNVQGPDISLGDFEANLPNTNINLPQFEGGLPGFNPQIPGIDLGGIDLSKYKLPNGELDLPKLKLGLPNIPGLAGVDLGGEALKKLLGGDVGLGDWGKVSQEFTPGVKFDGGKISYQPSPTQAINVGEALAGVLKKSPIDPISKGGELLGNLLNPINEGLKTVSGIAGQLAPWKVLWDVGSEIANAWNKAQGPSDYQKMINTRQSQAIKGLQDTLAYTQKTADAFNKYASKYPDVIKHALNKDFSDQASYQRWMPKGLNPYEEGELQYAIENIQNLVRSTPVVDPKTVDYTKSELPENFRSASQSLNEERMNMIKQMNKSLGTGIKFWDDPQESNPTYAEIMAKYRGG